jgi:4-hydroxy-3-polyprenylbenzoate decarboxylase
MSRPLIVAITGASGPIYGIRALELLRGVADVETHLILSAGGRTTIAYETDYAIDDVRALADVVHSERNLAASISSGSFRTAGMIVAPCSIKTLSGIAQSHSDNLVARAADVVLKERRPLVLMLRETPLHAGHVRLMQQAIENGAIMMPPVPAFYERPRTIAEIVDQSVGRALDQLGIDVGVVRRWQGPPAGMAAPDGE